MSGGWQSVFFFWGVGWLVGWGKVADKGKGVSICSPYTFGSPPHFRTTLLDQAKAHIDQHSLSHSGLSDAFGKRKTHAWTSG